MSILDNPNYNDPVAREMLRKFLEKHPEIDISPTEAHERMMQQARTANVKKEPIELEYMKAANKITNFGKKKQSLTEEQKRNITTYCQKIKEGANTQKMAAVVKKDFDLIPLEDAKKILGNVIRANLKKNNRSYDASAIAHIKSKGEYLELGYNNLLEDVLKYFVRDRSSKFNLNKGLFIFGQVGTGKSWILEIMQEVIKVAIDKGFDKMEQVYFDIHKMTKIAKDLRNEGDFKALNKYMNGSICYDDIGFEPTTIHIYKNEETVFNTIIDNQSIRHEKTNKIIHGTSNLLINGQNNSIQSTYGERISSRCLALFNCIWLQGICKRGR